MESPDWDKNFPKVQDVLSEQIQNDEESQSMDSQPNSKPSNLFEYIERAATLYVPSVVKNTESLLEQDNSQAVLTAKIPCTLTLRELVRAQPGIWEGITEDMVAQGLLKKGNFSNIDLAKTICMQAGLNKVSGIRGRDEGNTTLPINDKGIESIAILDSGAGISIAMKNIWEK